MFEMFLMKMFGTLASSDSLLKPLHLWICYKRVTCSIITKEFVYAYIAYLDCSTPYITIMLIHSACTKDHLST